MWGCRTLLLTLLLAAVPRPAQAQAGEPLPYRDPAQPVAERVRDLLARMTLDEKFWQLYMTPGDVDDPAHDWSAGVLGLQVSAVPGVPVPNGARAHADRINDFQR
jgi:beta-glucosidase